MAATRDDADFEKAPGEDLPWLEPAELEYSEGGGGFLTGRTVIIAALTIVGVVAVLWWLADYLGGGDIEIPEGNEIPVVSAPEGPYRVAPDEVGGLEIDDTEQAISAVAAGETLPGEVDTGSLPEVPVPVVPPVGTGNADGPPRDLMAEAQAAREAAAERDGDDPAQAEAVTAGPPSADAAAGTPAAVSSVDAVVQLGAFSTPAKANEVWATISGRYPYIAALDKSVETVAIEGKTLYRLRATGAANRAAANELCARLKLAGENCVVPK
ncbi:SPOR domain-containing protein [Pacificimonas sp. WHA3]|uniref:SPOR domain-containing protein n=1 Tax=Pacificimonas pallii TaxID=2827236 RepID=A0ABS6SEP3_9SPHN|nr:SPOR domain-containing protein [Pacificimonas pallii]MBV7256869.1 SPOR domain-containing protein [Pacificimonas pallii]